MDEQQARDDIKYIREMLDRTRRSTADSGTLFIFWGFWIILALIGNYALVYTHLFRWIWVDWTFFSFSGWVVTIWHSVRRGRKERIMTFAQEAAAYISFACGIAFALAAFALPLLGAYGYDVISIVIALVSGVLLFGLGGLFKAKFMLAAGLAWWLGAVGLVLIPGDWRGLGIVPLIIIGYLVPGFIFRAKYRNGK
ncbi:MAG: hypothetical protein PHI34_07600 [Acidobacteriota bacterium]|nr:hypothetical protein [Acidobacteriota bacterium]